MFRHHFGLKNEPLGKGNTELWDDGHLTLLKERFQWLLDSPGLGLLTGEPGVGKTAALRHVTATLNPHRFQVIYLAETDFGRIDIYCSLALASVVQQKPFSGIIPHRGRCQRATRHGEWIHSREVVAGQD